MCDDPNCTHGPIRRGWEAIGRFFGAWGHSENATSKQSNVTAGPIEVIDPQSPEEQEKYRKYNEEQLLPLNKVILAGAILARAWETGIEGLYMKMAAPAELAPLVVNSEANAAKGVVNSKGVAYPKVIVEDFGEVQFPKGPFTPNNSQVLRSQFTPKLKADFKDWWIQQGRSWPNVPEGSALNIHHIKPLGHGGTNSFDNLVPLIQPQQHQPFTNWWRGF